MSQRYTQPKDLPHQLGAEDVFLCSDWHGGLASRMYAVASTGDLTPGAELYDTPEDHASRWWDLASEAESCIRPAQADELYDDAEGLRSLADRAIANAEWWEERVADDG